MKLGLMFMADQEVSILTNIAKKIEDGGFDIIWLSDENFNRDVYISLASMAMATGKIKIGLGCTNPFTRHPIITSIAMATLNELSKGRAVLALGSGSTYDLLDPLEIHAKNSVGVCREAIGLIKAFLTGNEVSLYGKFFKVSKAKISFKPTQLPVYLACRGPKMLELAGEIADGALLNGIPLEYVDFALKRIEEGARKIGRGLKNFEVANAIAFAVSKNREEAINEAKKSLAFSIATTPAYVLERVGMGLKDLEPLFKALPELEKVSELITYEMVEKFSIAGSPEECIKRIEAFEKAGIEQLALIVPTSNLGMIELAFKEIIPYFE
ncbi:MAG: LLM class flavin-dependent oxidoreductase [Candidatus Bathyarchaeia archaeon]